MISKTPDLAALESFFSHGDGERARSLMELHGLLFAFAGAPETVPFIEMFHVACGDEEPEFASQEEASSVTGSFAALFNLLNEGVLSRQPTLPAGCVVRDEPMANLDPDAPLSQWSRGFQKGFRYVRDDWDDWLPDELELELADELAASLMILTLFASRESADDFREDLQADGTTLEQVAASSVRLFPDAMATYAGLGRSIHEARLRLEEEGPAEPGAEEPAGPAAEGSAHSDRSGTRSAGTGTPSSELFELLVDLPEPEWDDWLDYGARGVTPPHEAELIEIATNLNLLDADEGSPEGWAPIHACRGLGELRSERAMTPLLDALGAGTASDDWLAHDLPAVFAAVGPPAIDPLVVFATDRSLDEYARMSAITGLGRIAALHEGAREACVGGMTRILEGFAGDDPDVNAILIGELVDLEAREAAPLMRAAFEAGRVDPTFMGDWEDVQIELGLLTERRTPRPSMDEWRRRRPTAATPLPGWRSLEPPAVEVLGATPASEPGRRS